MNGIGAVQGWIAGLIVGLARAGGRPRGGPG